MHQLTAADVREALNIVLPQKPITQGDVGWTPMYFLKDMEKIAALLNAKRAEQPAEDEGWRSVRFGKNNTIEFTDNGKLVHEIALGGEPTSEEVADIYQQFMIDWLNEGKLPVVGKKVC